MKIYLTDVPFEEAWSKLKGSLSSSNLWKVLGEEELPLDENVLGRVLSSPIWAKISSPHYHASAMDGFAVKSSETKGALLTSPITLFCDKQELQNKAEYLDTGDPLPEWADAVIPIENVESLDGSDQLAENIRYPYKIRIRSAVTPWSHIRPMGEDMIATELVLPSGQILRPADIGGIAASGHSSVKVSRKPRVAIIPTGSELVPVGRDPKIGEIIEYNSLVLASQVNLWGGEAQRYPIAKDDFEAIKTCVKDAAENYDLILLNAGSSAGSEDFSAKVIQSLGEVLVHGIAIRPGHPVILGMVERRNSNEGRVPIIGVPGFPVSTAMTGELFVEPLIARWSGRIEKQYPVKNATITRKVTSKAGDNDYMRVTVGKVGENVLAAPLSRGSGVISSLINADGIVVIPSGSQGLSAGSNVIVRMYRSDHEIDKTIFAIGSHDMVLDLIAQYLSPMERRLASTNVGSLAGLIALRNNQAHVAGAHLLDPKTGEYNLSYVKEYLHGISVIITNLVWRQQGLYVRRGNPKKIQQLQDIANDGITFINRQRGAGTRVLLDYQLQVKGISTNGIRGYNHEEYTHLSVAAAVQSGRADCGLGIAAAASALELDFIPLFNERYDLVIPAKFYEENLMRPLINLLSNPQFQKTVETLPGYNIEEMGTIIAKIK